MVKHHSVHTNVNIACDREAERGHVIFQGKQSVNPHHPEQGRSGFGSRR